MAQSFDILDGQYLEMIKCLRDAFTQKSTELVEVVLNGTLNGKSKSVTLGIQTAAPYYLLWIHGHRLSATEESYAKKPMPHPFNLTHIHGALELKGPQRNEADKKAFVSMVFITSEAARFEPFARHINTLIQNGDGAKALNYLQARFYMNHWKNLFEWTHGTAAAYFKPLTEANMHNWNFYHEMVIHKRRNMQLDFADTQASLAPKSLREFR